MARPPPPEPTHQAAVRLPVSLVAKVDRYRAGKTTPTGADLTRAQRHVTPH